MVGSDALKMDGCSKEEFKELHYILSHIGCPPLRPVRLSEYKTLMLDLRLTLK